MPSDPLSRPLIEIARDLRERRASARELVEAAIARHERFGERLHAYSFWRRIRPEPSPTRPTPHSPPVSGPRSIRVTVGDAGMKKERSGEKIALAQCRDEAGRIVGLVTLL